MVAKQANAERRGRSTTLSAITALLLGYVFQISPAHAQTIAMVTDVTGKAIIVNSGETATILMEIQSGTQLRLASGSQLVALYLASGAEYVFAGSSHIEFLQSEPRVHSGPEPQRRASVFHGHAALKASGLTQAAFVMRSARAIGKVKLLTVAGTITLDRRPEFRWEPVEGAASYRFELSDGGGRMLLEHNTVGNSYTLPESVQLEEGSTYTWEVSTRSSDGRRYIAVADFTVASGVLKRDVEALRPPGDARFSDHVAFAAWLHGAGLKDEARKYWRRLAAERPSDSKLKALAVQ